mmetsp:Transcript_31384/g.79614  ORF Transcript_31384/g.79614 Transcript_31384/m.79614 type:complete len:82 (-) Transcript_31384:3043-3288(-)
MMHMHSLLPLLVGTTDTIPALMLYCCMAVRMHLSHSMLVCSPGPPLQHAIRNRVAPILRVMGLVTSQGIYPGCSFSDAFLR